MYCDVVEYVWCCSVSKEIDYGWIWLGVISCGLVSGLIGVFVIEVEIIELVFLGGDWLFLVSELVEMFLLSVLNGDEFILELMEGL